MKRRKELTPEQRAATEARRAAFRALARRVAKMTEDERNALIARMPAIVTVEGRALSAVNSILIGFQLPAATIVGGFQQWKKHGRSVKKGEHGAAIWIPGGAGKVAEAAMPDPGAADGDGEGGGIKFLTATVFDVTQTAEIAAGDDPSRVIDIGENPVAVVSPEVADAFGMRNLPNVIVRDPEDDRPEWAKEPGEPQQMRLLV